MHNVATFNLQNNELIEARNINDSLPLEKKKKGVFNHVVDINKGYFANNVVNDPYYIAGVSGIKSQLTIPLRNENVVLGVMSFYSSKIDFFDEKKMDYLQRFVDASVSSYLRLKLSFSIGKLVLPYSLYEKHGTFKATCERLSKYFLCSNIIIWHSEIGSNHIFSPEYIFGEFYENKNSFLKFTDFDFNVIYSSEPQIVQLDNSQNLNRLESFLHTRNINTVIYTPIDSYRGKNRFITLCSRRKVESLFAEDRSFFSHITNKFLLSITFFKIFDFFNSLTRINYRQDISVIFKDLMPKIQEITGSDILLLFMYDKNQADNKFVQVIEPIGKLNDERLKERYQLNIIKENDFSYSIIKNGSQWIDSDELYTNFRKKQTKWEGWDVFKDDFWHREKIKSLAALRIEFDDEILGVLYFNYREKQQFNERSKNESEKNKAIENRQLLGLLANLIGRMIKISRTLDEDRNFIIKKFNASILNSRSEVALGMIHNIMNLSHIVSTHYGLLTEIIDEEKIDNSDLNNLINLMGDSLYKLKNDYLIYNEYFKNVEFNIQEINAFYFFEEQAILIKSLYNHRKNKILFHFQNIPKNNIIFGDKLQLSHVILNLVKNSIEADADTIWLNFIPKDNSGQYYVIEIKDNGKGIKDDMKTKIFQPSWTSKREGTGMGLPISQHVINNHGGRIDFRSLFNKSNKNSGTTFFIYIPITPKYN